MKEKAIGQLVKTNPNKANFKRDDDFSAYYTRDFHGATAAHYANLDS